MAKGENKDYGDEGKTSFSKKSKLAPVTSPKPKAKPAVEAKSTKSAGPVRPKDRPLAPFSSKRPMTASKKAANMRGDMAADIALMKQAGVKKKPEAEMTRQERKKAGLPVSPLGRFIAKVNSAAERASANAKKREGK